MKVGLYFHTLKYLKPKQLIFQLLRRIYKPKITFIDYNPKLRSQLEVFNKSLSKQQSLIEPNIFQFFNENGDLDQISWNGEQKEKLWRYNQHYFDDLNSHTCELRLDWHLDLLERWVHENPPRETVGWEAYPTSLRVVNWIKWSFRFNKLSKLCVKSLFNQGLLLEKNIEYHILGNHFFANGKALIFLGVFFDNTIANRWIRKGMQMISEALNDQILPDGAHYELSPMYHSIILEDILDLINILRLYSPGEDESLLNELENVIPEMLTWMTHMSFDDGHISSFNDSANNITSNPQDIINYAVALGFKAPKKNITNKLDYYHLESSGYIVIYKNDFKIILDVAKLGPDNLLAHGHADTLTFELAKGANRIFVNSGTSCYGLSKRRDFERSTKAHNTVEVNNVSSSETWSSFRVAKRAYPYDLSIKKYNENLDINCSHDGYKRLSNNLSHSRLWNFNENIIAIEDTINGHHESAVSRFILHSDVVLNRITDNNFNIILADSFVIKLNICIGNARIVEWEHTNEFGCVYKTVCIEVSLLGGKSLIELI